MKKLQIVTIYESKLYQKEHDFKNEDKKDEYYTCDFWQDSDYILIEGKSIPIVCIDDEIIYDELGMEAIMSNWDGFTDNQEKRIIAFYTDELFDQYKATGQFVELSTWPQDIKESSEAMKTAPLAIKYRGGQGYNYGWWILTK